MKEVMLSMAEKIHNHCVEQHKKVFRLGTECDNCTLHELCKQTWSSEIMPMYWFKNNKEV